MILPQSGIALWETTDHFIAVHLVRTTTSITSFVPGVILSCLKVLSH